MLDIGLLLVRAVVGGLLAGHGMQKLAGWFGGPGIAGNTDHLRTLGYRHPRRMAWLHGLAETVAGVLFLAGALTPVAAAVIVAVMINAAIAVHAPNGLWVQRGGYEYPLVLGAAALGVAFAGPGRLSLDAAVGWQPTHGWTLAVLCGGLVAGALALATRRRSTSEQPASRRTHGPRTPAAA